MPDKSRTARLFRCGKYGRKTEKCNTGAGNSPQLIRLRLYTSGNALNSQLIDSIDNQNFETHP